MKIKAFVKPNAKKDEVMPQTDGTYIIRLAAPPIEGRANERLCRVVADYFHVAKSTVQVVSGLRSRYKYIEIEGHH